MVDFDKNWRKGGSPHVERAHQVGVCHHPAGRNNGASRVLSDGAEHIPQAILIRIGRKGAQPHVERAHQVGVCPLSVGRHHGAVRVLCLGAEPLWQAITLKLISA